MLVKSLYAFTVDVFQLLKPPVAPLFTALIPLDLEFNITSLKSDTLL